MTSGGTVVSLSCSYLVLRGWIVKAGPTSASTHSRFFELDAVKRELNYRANEHATESLGTLSITNCYVEASYPENTERCTLTISGPNLNTKSKEKGKSYILSFPDSTLLLQWKTGLTFVGTVVGELISPWNTFSHVSLEPERDLEEKEEREEHDDDDSAVLSDDSLNIDEVLGGKKGVQEINPNNGKDLMDGDADVAGHGASHVVLPLSVKLVVLRVNGSTLERGPRYLGIRPAFNLHLEVTSQPQIFLSTREELASYFGEEPRYVCTRNHLTLVSALDQSATGKAASVPGGSTCGAAHSEPRCESVINEDDVLSGEPLPQLVELADGGGSNYRRVLVAADADNAQPQLRLVEKSELPVPGYSVVEVVAPSELAYQRAVDPPTMKLLILGAQGVGKSTVARWIAESAETDQSASMRHNQSTSFVFTSAVGAVERHVHFAVGGVPTGADVLLIDLPGNASQSLMSSHLSDADIILAVFDYTELESFAWVEEHMAQIRTAAAQRGLPAATFVVGTKADNPRALVDRPRAQGLKATLIDLADVKNADGSISLLEQAKGAESIMSLVEPVLERRVYHHLMWKEGWRRDETEQVLSVWRSAKTCCDALKRGKPRASGIVSRFLEELGLLRPIQQNSVEEILSCRAVDASYEQSDETDESLFDGISLGHVLRWWTAWEHAGDMRANLLSRLLQQSVLERALTAKKKSHAKGDPIPNLDFVFATAQSVFAALATNEKMLGSGSEKHLTSRAVGRAFALYGLALDFKTASTLLKSIDISSDDVVEESDFVSWWQYPGAITAQFGSDLALAASLWKARTQQDSAAAVRLAAACVTHTHARPLTQQQAASSTCCARCGAEFNLLRMKHLCALCKRAYCNDCIGEEVPVLNSKATDVVLVRMCRDCRADGSCPAPWQADEDAERCPLCNEPFSLLRRKHHCRACGTIVCSKCSPHEILVKGYRAPQRVCSACETASVMKADCNWPDDAQHAQGGRTQRSEERGADKASRDGAPTPSSSDTASTDTEDEWVLNRAKVNMQYTLPWYDNYDSEEEKALFRHAVIPPILETTPLREYIVVQKGYLDEDGAVERAVTAEEEELYGPRIDVDP